MVKFRYKIIISIIFLILTLFLSVLADRLTGKFISDNPGDAGLIFPPHSDYHYRTPEFDFTAKINSLGFRDREFEAVKNRKTRILAIGDSYTFGWGVNLENSWTKILEADLQKNGSDVEVANLGAPGASPLNYAQIGDNAIPLLKPDVVLIGALQGDDLASLETDDSPPKVSAPTGFFDRLTSLRFRLYPNFISLYDKYNSQKSLSEVWKNQAKDIAGTMTAEENLQFDKVDPDIKQAFFSGELNPALVQIAVKRPNFFLNIFQIEKPEVQNLINTMAQDFQHLKETARQNNARVIVVSIPYKVYASQHDLESSRRLGLNLIPEMTQSNSADQAIENASRIAGVEFVSVTKDFRNKAESGKLFFEMDGHLNAAGHQIFADLLAPKISEMQLSEH